MPLDIMLIVLHEFLGDHKTISALDVACSQSYRPSLLAVLQHPSFRLTDLGPSLRPRMKNYAHWLNTRQVRLHQMKLRACNVVVQSELSPVVLGSVKEVELEDLGSKEIKHRIKDAFFAIFSKLKSLNKVHSANSYVDFSYLANHPSLPLQCIQGCLPTSHLHSLVDVFHNSLRELIFTNGWWCATLFPSSVILKCRQLSKLSLLEHDLSLDTLIDLLDGLPFLRDLSFFCSGEEVRLFEEESSIQEELVPRFKQLERLIIFGYGFIRDGPGTMLSILTACPQLQELKFHEGESICWKAIGNNQWALAVSWRGWTNWKKDGQASFCAFLRTCSVPIAELETLPVDAETLKVIEQVAGPSLRKISLGAYSASWSERDVKDFLSSCKVLTSLSWSVAEEVNDQRLHAMIHICPHLHELQLCHALRVSDAGMAGALIMGGAMLTKLVLDQCTKLSQHTLTAITRHCTNLRELVILQTSIKAPNILESIILPDKLKSLRRLRVSGFVYKAIMESGNQVEKTRFARCLCKA